MILAEPQLFSITTPDETFFQILDDPSVLKEFVSQAHAHVCLLLWCPRMKAHFIKEC